MSYAALRTAQPAGGQLVKLPRARLMLVDDSAVTRAVFERIFDGDPEVELIHCSPSAGDAIGYLAAHPVDIVLLDIDMPVRSGLDALPDILSAAGNARVMIVSAYAEANGPAAIRALELGACDTLAKPGANATPGQFARLLIDKVRRLARQRSSQARCQAAAVPIVERPLDQPPGCIAIGASTGGIPALLSFIDALSPAIDCPILVTQHLPAEFMPFLVRQLAQRTSRIVQIAPDGEAPRRNHVYVAPGNAHLRCIRPGTVPILTHSDEVVALNYRPSVDPMLEGVAEAYGAGGVGIMLSGMGNDGASGARALTDAGGIMMAQDPGTSVVWGMPGAVARAGLAASIAPPGRLAELVNASIKTESAR